MSMEQTVIDSVSKLNGEHVVGGLAGVAGIYLAFKRFAVRVATEDVNISEARATTAVIELLRSEIERLALTNEKLVNELVLFQIENAKLTRKVNELSESLDEMKTKLEIVKIRGRRSDWLEGEERRSQ